MRILSLELINIGPFEKGFIDFISSNDSIDNPPITIITGENGTGKTIVLDAIRALFLGESSSIERNIVRNEPFQTQLNFYDDNISNNYYSIKIKKLACIRSNSRIKNILLLSDNIDSNNVKNSFIPPISTISKRFSKNTKPDSTWNWVIDYWTSKLSTDTFEIKNLVSPNPEDLYYDSLSGIHKNVEVTQLICFFDYLKSSDDEKEKQLGEILFDTLKKIIKISLKDGEFKYVSRKTLEPVVTQAGQEITLDKLSSGNLYLIQRMVSLLGKMYRVHILNNSPIEDFCKASGILLIDEAENHLHPKWQKTFLKSIQEIFPKLQIILTTHSPFIVSSVENAKIYVCESEGDHAVIKDETDLYSNKPIEEILLSPLFGVTYPFNQEITNLMQDRKIAISEKNKSKKLEIENKLKEINPQYFSFFDVDNLLEELKA